MDSGNETGNDSNDASVIQHIPLINTVKNAENIQLSFSNELKSFLNQKPVINLNVNTEALLPTSAETTNDNIMLGFSFSYCDKNIFENALEKKAYLQKRRRRYIMRKTLMTQSKEYKMRIAASTNNVELLQKLLSEGVSPNNFDRLERSPLHLAASRGYTEIVELLLSYGANPNVKDRVGNTPLHLATVTSKTAVVNLLLKAGTNVLSSDSYGNNPLDLAKTKLRVLQNSLGIDMNNVKSEVTNIIEMLVLYLQKQTNAQEQIEALSNICSRLSLSNTNDQIQDDVKSLLNNLETLSLKN